MVQAGENDTIEVIFLAVPNLRGIAHAVSADHDVQAKAKNVPPALTLDAAEITSSIAVWIF